LNQGIEFAAVLTVIGIRSMIAVIVFDRIRENTKITEALTETGQGYSDDCNQPTLGRTLITVIYDVWIVVIVSFWFFGGEVLRGFSLP